jgi:hypothetical protein
VKIDKQLEEWVKGNSIHNDERDECCPDFSCCQPDLLADEKARLIFVKAFKENDQETQNSMLMMFLGNLLKNENVHIAGMGATQ